MIQRPIYRVIIVDDDSDDYEILSRALKSQCPAAATRHISTLDEWNAFLTDFYPVLSLVLMDYNFPPATGVELLHQIKKESNLQHVPVVIWSATVNPQDIMACYNAGAAAFIQKPDSYETIKNSMHVFCEYWFNLVQLPRH